MEAYQSADQELGAVFGCLRERVVQKQGITNRPIDDTIKDVRKSFALFSCQCDWSRCSRDQARLTTRFWLFFIISREKFLRYVCSKTLRTS